MVDSYTNLPTIYFLVIFRVIPCFSVVNYYLPVVFRVLPW
jgi:hypothetical protein